MSKRLNTPLKIQKGVPIPTKDRRGRPYFYPWRDMQVGDSVVISADPTTDTGLKAISSARTAASRYGAIHEMKFRALSNAKGITVWRIK